MKELVLLRTSVEKSREGVFTAKFQFFQAWIEINDGGKTVGSWTRSLVVGDRASDFLHSQSVWQIVTQISWASLLVQSVVGIKQYLALKLKSVPKLFSTYHKFLLCYEMSSSHWRKAVTWLNASCSLAQVKYRTKPLFHRFCWPLST